MSDEKYRIAQTTGGILGIHLAIYEREITNNPYDIEALQRVALISEAYHNFATAGLSEFSAEFSLGYRIGKRDLATTFDETLDGEQAPTSARDNGPSPS